jgi:hypothetical protein
MQSPPSFPSHGRYAFVIIDALFFSDLLSLFFKIAGKSAMSISREMEDGSMRSLSPWWGRIIGGSICGIMRFRLGTGGL